MKHWIGAMRVRTLPLSIAGIVTGGVMAYNHSAGGFNYYVFLLALVTALLLQILSNFANDYGDFENGADNESRKGPQRAVQSGSISAMQMRQAIIITASLTIIAGCCLLFAAFRDIDTKFILYFILGLACVVAALKYTMGKNPYGYKGWGDLFVFVFFGPVSATGIYFLITGMFSWPVLLPSISIGAWSTAVLNLNNLRDMENDKAAGKITIPVRLGKSKGLAYQFILILLPFISNTFYAIIMHNNLLLALNILALIPAYILFKPLTRQPNHISLDNTLKKTALFTLVFTILFVLGVLLNQEFNSTNFSISDVFPKTIMVSLS